VIKSDKFMHRIKIVLIFFFVLTIIAGISNEIHSQNPIYTTDKPNITERNIKFIDYPGFPEQHSTWNSIGYSPSHHQVYVGVSDHLKSNALYKYDVALETMSKVGFIEDMANLRNHQWQGKVHSKFVEGPNGEMYFSTDGGVLRSLHFRDHPHGYSGGYFMKFDPATHQLTNLGKGMKYDTVKDMDVDPETGVMYGISFPQVHFMVYDPATNDFRDLGRLGGGHVPRVNFTDQWGNNYYVDWRQRLVKYEKKLGELIFAKESLPAFDDTPGSHIITGITAYAKDRENGIIYIITYGAKVLAFHPAEEGIGEIVDLGPVYELEEELWRPYVPNLAFGKNGKLYYFIGGHGNFVKDDTTIFMELDPSTGERNIIYEFHISDMVEATGSDVQDSDGNLYFAGRKRVQDTPQDGDIGTDIQVSESGAFMIKFNPENEVYP
jgi:hypothetical protein